MARDRSSDVTHSSSLVPNAVIAAAQRKDIRSPRGKANQIRKDGWQERCWYFYDVIGEFYYGMNWLGNLLSRATLYVSKNGKRVSSGPAALALNALFGGPIAQGEMLRQLGIHLGVAGEGYIVGVTRGSRDEWLVAANTRLQGSSDAGFKLDGEPLNSPLILRVYRPHPLDPTAATSSARPALPILANLEGLAKRASADIDSRLTGNGLLFLPSEVSFPSMPVTTNEGEPTQQDAYSGADGIQNRLIEAASIAIQDPDSAAAKVPLVMTMPGDRIDAVKHITFWSDFDEKMPELEDRAIRRLALALDMPPEALTGTGQMNHWNAWQLEEAAIKVHTEPMLNLITNALTEGFLWPVLQDENVADFQSYTIEADTTELRLRPNRSKEAQELYDRGALSLDAMLRENGFDPEDKMDTSELQNWLLRKVASGSTTPELVAEALRVIGVPIEEPQEASAQMPETPAPSLREHPTRDIPNNGVPPEISAAAEVLVYRALERAGNRLKTRGHKVPDGTRSYEMYAIVPFRPNDVDYLLQDAWEACGVFGMERFAQALDTYTRSLLATRVPHSRDTMNRYLEKAL